MRNLLRYFALLSLLMLPYAVVQAEPTDPAPAPHYITLKAAQVAELLTPDKHLEKLGTTILQFYWFPLFRGTKPPKIEAQRDFAFFLLQKEAIRTAGEQKMVALVPNLVYYMDYQKYEEGFGLGSNLYNYTVKGDRETYPAIEALMSMGQDAVAPLQTLAGDPKAEVTQRVRALYVLHYLDATASQATASAMTAEFEKAGDTATVTRIHAAISDDPNERGKAFHTG